MPSYTIAQFNVKILSGQNILNFLFFGALSISSEPKLGLKVQVKKPNVNLSITITHIDTESSWLKGCRQ